MKKQAFFINRKFCAKNGVSFNLPLEKFVIENKKYYQEVEDYDWVDVADHFRGLEAILHRLREREALRLVKEFAVGDKFLDAGCGTGLILRHLPVGSIGLDINRRNIKRAKKHVAKAKLILGDIKNLPFDNRSLTTIICTEVLEHLLEPQKALKEFFRVLKSNGVLIGSVPAQNPVWRLRILSSTHPGEPYHRLYQNQEIQALLKPYGRILYLKKGCLGMNFFFVVAKKND